MNTFTSGPWIAAAGPSSIVGWPIVAQTGRLICNLATPPKDIDRIGKAKDQYDEFMAECGANARLIAAAPDLLQALKGLLSDIENYQRINNLGGENNHWQVISRAVLAKAEGRS